MTGIVSIRGGEKLLVEKLGRQDLWLGEEISNDAACAPVAMMERSGMIIGGDGERWQRADFSN